MPLEFYSEGEKWGIRDIEGDIVFPAIFDSFNTSSDDLNYTHFTCGGKRGYLVLCPYFSGTTMLSDANRIRLWKTPALFSHRHKGMLFLVFCKDDVDKGLDSPGKDKIWMDTPLVEKELLLADLENHLSTLRSVHEYSEAIDDAMREFAEKYEDLLAPPANKVGANMFVEVYDYLATIYHAAEMQKVPLFPSRWESAINMAYDNILLLPRIFFGETELARYLTIDIQIHGLPENIKMSFADFMGLDDQRN